MRSILTRHRSAIYTAIGVVGAVLFVSAVLIGVTGAQHATGTCGDNCVHCP